MAKDTDRYGYILEFERPIVELEAQVAKLREAEKATGVDMSDVINSMDAKIAEKIRNIYSKLTPWQKIELSRHQRRPVVNDYIKLIVKDFIPLHGDKLFGEDRAMICGLGKIDDERVMIIGTEKGRTTEEKQRCHFGYPHPEGYRKAIYKMKLAEKFNIPVVCFIDTKGAFPGIGAEERGQSLAIAYNLKQMVSLRTPVISVIIGEGGSGGALAIGVADVLAILEYAYFGVITPEGCAAILWKDAERKADAAESLKLTSEYLLQYKLVDEVVPEPSGGAHRDHVQMADTLKAFILRRLKELKTVDMNELLNRRYEKVRRIGVFESSNNGASVFMPIEKSEGSNEDVK